MAEPPSSGESAAPSERVPLDQLIAQPTPPDSGPKEQATESPPPKKKPRRISTADERRAREVAAQLRLANKKTSVEIEEHKSRISRDEEDHRLLWQFRKRFGIAGLVIVVLWQFVILRIAWCQGDGRLRLSDPVMIALVTTTTANVIGLLVIVMKFVFAPLPPPKSADHH